MKRTKKFFSLAVAVIMMLAMAIPAFATGSTGSIQVTNATVDQTYTAYKVLDATYSGSNVSYTIASNSQWFDLVNAETSPFNLDQARTENGVTTYYVTAKTDANVLDWMRGLDVTGMTAEGAATKATSDTVSWNVPYGYYLITSDLGGAAVTVDSNTPNVHIIDKNQTSGWGPEGGKFIMVDGEKVTENSVNYGDTVDFKIVSTAATSYNGDKMVTAYIIHDELTSDMTMTGEPVVKVNGNTLTKGTDYTYTTTTTDDCTFEISIPWTANNAPKYNSNNTIEVTYSATVNTGAALDTALTNDAQLKWTDASGGTGSSEKVTTESVTYGLAIQKVNPEGTPLAGATFTLKLGDTQIKVDPTEIPGVYNYNVNGTLTEVVSPASGLIVIKGVEAGTYALTETVAPDGYNRVVGAMEITAAENCSTQETITVYYDADGKVVETAVEQGTSKEITLPLVALPVVNRAGVELPSTGGMGTTLFYMIGGALVAGAAILLVAKKKVANQG